MASQIVETEEWKNLLYVLSVVTTAGGYHQNEIESGTKVALVALKHLVSTQKIASHLKELCNSETSNPSFKKAAIDWLVEQANSKVNKN